MKNTQAQITPPPFCALQQKAWNATLSRLQRQAASQPPPSPDGGRCLPNGWLETRLLEGLTRQTPDPQGG